MGLIRLEVMINVTVMNDFIGRLFLSEHFEEVLGIFFFFTVDYMDSRLQVNLVVMKVVFFGWEAKQRLERSGRGLKFYIRAVLV